MGLNASQTRKVVIGLRMLEQELVRMERFLEGDEVGILYQRRTRLEPPEQNALRNHAATMRAILRLLKQRLDLPVETSNGRSMLANRFAFLWVDLDEIRPGSLRGLGHVDPDLSETLEPDIVMLMQSLRAMSHILADGLVEGADGERR